MIESRSQFFVSLGPVQTVSSRFHKEHLVLLAIAGLYLYSFPYFPGLQSANELPRVYLTQAMVEEGRFAIDSGVSRWGSTADVSRAHGQYYSNKAPGSSMLAIPPYMVLRAVKRAQGSEPTLAEMMWVSRISTGVVPTLLFLVLLAAFLARFTDSRDARRIAVVGYALGSMAMVYSVLFIAHQLSAVCIGTAYILGVRVVEDRRDSRLMLAAGFAAGCAPLVDYQAAFAGVPLAIYLIWSLVIRPPSGRPGRAIGRPPPPRKVDLRRGRGDRLGGHLSGRRPGGDLARRRPGALALAVLGSIPPVVLLLWYHQQAFGSPFATGYDYSQTFAHFHQKGFLGITELRWEAFHSSTVGSNNGLFTFCPLLILAIPGWILMARRRLHAQLALTASVVVIYLLFLSSINFWRGGWQIGPRYITAMLPFMMVPVTVAVDAACRRSATRALVLALMVVGIAVYTLTSAMFPYFPEKFSNPLYEVTLGLIADGHAPWNLGWIFGLRGTASLIPLLAILAAVLGFTAVPRRALWRSGLLGLAGGVAIVGLYRFMPDGGPAAANAYQWITSIMPR